MCKVGLFSAFFPVGMMSMMSDDGGDGGGEDNDVLSFRMITMIVMMAIMIN